MSENIISPYEISEDDVKIKGHTIFTDPGTNALWQRSMILFRQKALHYRSILDRGKELFDFYNGNIFTRKQIQDYKNVHGKFPVQPRIMKSPINALVGQIINGRRSGQLTSEGGSIDHPSKSSEVLEIGNIVMKDMEQKFKERDLTRELVTEGLISCYPVWTILELGAPVDGVDGKLQASLLPWDSTLPGPFNWRSTDDIRTLDYVEFQTVADMMENYPERAEIIKNHRGQVKTLDATLKESIIGWENTNIDALDKERLYHDAVAGFGMAVIPNGYHQVIKRLFQIRRKEVVAINLFDPREFIVKPGNWDDERWKAAIAMESEQKNTEYEFAEQEVSVLWRTDVTTSGIVLENEKHWFQENGMLPGAAFVPMISNNVPTGPADDMRDNVLKNAVFETEFLHDVREGSGQLLVLRSGTVENIDSLTKETSKGVGTLIVKKNAPLDLRNAITNIDRRPNTAMLEYADKIKRDIEEQTRINQSIMGQVNASQSGISKQLEIGQGMVVQAIYIENVNRYWSNWQNIKAKAIPYGYTEHQILQVMDEENGDTIVAEVNKPVYDIAGNVALLANDLTSTDFKWKIMPVDDSPTAKMQEWEQAIIFLNSTPGPLMQADPSGKLLAKFMMSMPNRFLKDAGKALAEDAEMKQQQISETQKQEALVEGQKELAKAQSELQKTKNQKVNISLTGEQLAEFPQLMAFLQQIGYFGNEGALQQGGAAQGQAVQPPVQSQENAQQGQPVAEQLSLNI